MKILQVEFKGFKSFGNKVSFTFPDKQGLFFITGSNQADKTLEANGVGKSTLVDGICWVFFDKTPQNLRASEIGSWFSKEKTEGSVTLFNKNGFLQIKRTWSPNNLTLKFAERLEDLVNVQEKPVTQDKLQEFLQMDFESFLNSIVFSQFANAFFDLRPAQRTELFAKVSNLDYWDDLSKKSSEKHILTGTLVQDLDRTQQNLLGKLETLKSFSYDSKIQQWDFDNAAKIQEVEKTINEEIIEKLTSFEQNLQDLNRKKQKLIKEIKVAEESNRDLLDLEISANKEVEINKKAYDRASSTVAIHKNNINKLERAKDKCPTCGQAVDISHILKEKETEQAILWNAEQELAILRENNENALFIFKEIEQELQDFKILSHTQTMELKQIEYERGSVENNVNQLLRQKQTLEKTVVKLKQEQNPFIIEKQKCEKSIENIEKELVTVQESKNQLESLKDNYKFWIKGFKEVKFFIINQLLQQLEVATNNNLQSLGLTDWKINYAMEKENASGSISRGFNIFIFSPRNNKAVSWENWSGGERQRLLLAGQLGLSDLILSKLGHKGFIEFYDEPTAHLSTSGVSDLVELLKTRARTRNRQIWLIDHKNLQDMMFDGVLMVEKDKNGNSSLRLQ